MPDLRSFPLRLTPDLRARPWAGSRLGPADAHIGEAWLAYGGSVVADGPAAGRTLDDLAHELGEAMVGTQGAIRGRGRFPLLAKLIDTAEWLSIQVHPDDAQALALEGEPGIGKTEAWLVLEAGEDAQILIGRDPGATPAAIRAAIGTPDLPQLLRSIRPVAGDRIGVPAGTLHAIGPDLLVYEIQQPCDITYRAWDWGRKGREVHTEQSRAVVDPDATGEVHGRVPHGHAGAVAWSAFYLVMQLTLSGGSSSSTTDGRSPHVLTVLDGDVTVATAGGAAVLGRHETVVVPAAAGPYDLVASGDARVLVATVP